MPAVVHATIKYFFYQGLSSGSGCSGCKSGNAAAQGSRVQFHISSLRVKYTRTAFDLEAVCASRLSIIVQVAPEASSFCCRLCVIGQIKTPALTLGGKDWL